MEKKKNIRVLGKGKFTLRRSEEFHFFSQISTFSCMLRTYEKDRCELVKRIDVIKRSEISHCETGIK